MFKHPNEFYPGIFSRGWEGNDFDIGETIACESLDTVDGSFASGGGEVTMGEFCDRGGDLSGFDRFNQDVEIRRWGIHGNKVNELI